MLRSLLAAAVSPRARILHPVYAAAQFPLALALTGSVPLAAACARRTAQGYLGEAARTVFWAWDRARRHPGRPDQLLLDMPRSLRGRALDDLERFIARRTGRDTHVAFRLDRLRLVAARARLDLEARDLAAYARGVQAFGLALNEILPILGDEAPPPRLIAARPSPYAGSIRPERANRAMADFAALAERAGARRWFAISGTFLGMVRDGGWLPHDYDVDLGVFADDPPSILDFVAAARAAPAFPVARLQYQARVFAADGSPQVEALPAVLKLVHRSGIRFDLFVHYTEDGVCWHGSRTNRWDNTPFELAPYGIGGMEVLGPVDADRYLTENYGDWRVPRPDFNSLIDTPNIRIIRSLPDLANFVARIACVRSMGNGAGAATLLAVLDRSGAVRWEEAGRVFDPAFAGYPNGVPSAA